MLLNINILTLISIFLDRKDSPYLTIINNYLKENYEMNVKRYVLEEKHHGFDALNNDELEIFESIIPVRKGIRIEFTTKSRDGKFLVYNVEFRGFRGFRKNISECPLLRKGYNINGKTTQLINYESDSDSDSDYY